MPVRSHSLTSDTRHLAKTFERTVEMMQAVMDIDEVDRAIRNGTKFGVRDDYIDVDAVAIGALSSCCAAPSEMSDEMTRAHSTSKKLAIHARTTTDH